MKKLLGFSSAIAVLLFACSSARATLFTIDAGGNQQVLSSNSVGTVTPQPNGASEWKGTLVQPGSYSLQWDLVLDPDPSVAGSIALTNTAATTQTFTLNVSQPVSPTIPAGSPISGASALSIADANGNGSASLDGPSGGFLYTAFINTNVTQKTLFPASVAPLPLNVSTVGGVNTASQSFSTGTTTAAATAMGITHSFTLTAGDTATTNSTFTITTVPEPCTMALAAIGGLGLIAVRRNRRK